MSEMISTAPSYGDLFERAVVLKSERLSEELAHGLLASRFPSSDQKRLKRLAAKQRSGKITPEELGEMDRYIQVADLLEVLKAKAAAALQTKP